MAWGARRLLVATDFSEGARAAVRVAASIARRTGAVVDLACVLDPRPASAVVSRALGEIARASDAGRRQALALEHLGQVAAEAELATWVGHVATGDPVAEIGALRERLAPDLLVLGARAGVLRRFALGSVADAMLRSPGCPLLIVNAPVPGGEFKRILVGIELPDRSSPWLEIALGLAHDLRGEVIALHLLPPAGHVADRRHVELAPERVPAEIETLLGTLDRTVPVEVHVERGVPADAIPRIARAAGAELVVIGAERHASGWPGEVAESCGHAGLPALLVAWPEKVFRSTRLEREQGREGE
jgi:nucleotide-binding universal stress UspA family protein